jgi:hypothetical protein
MKYHKLSKTTPWRKGQKTFLYHGIKRIYGLFRGRYFSRNLVGTRVFYPRNNFILCHGIKIKAS